jgi:hypothetical protein
MDGSDFQYSRNLRKLKLDMTRFNPPHSSQLWEHDSVYENKFYTEHYLFSKVNGLRTYLSIKSTWYTVEVEAEDEDGYLYNNWIDVPISQGMLMKMAPIYANAALAS